MSETPETRPIYQTRDQAMTWIRDTLGEYASAHDLDAMFAKTFAWRGWWNESGAIDLTRSGYTMTATTAEFWEAARESSILPDRAD